MRSGVLVARSRALAYWAWDVHAKKQTRIVSEVSIAKIFCKRLKLAKVHAGRRMIV